MTPDRPIPPLPSVGPNPLRGAFGLRHPADRWPIALRVGFDAVAVITIGWAAGDTAAGLLAAIGVFTASYGHSRPYLNRAVHMGFIAVGMALATALGVWASGSVLTAVPMMAAIAAVATFLCQALQVEVPGAYLFVLVCASGVGMAAAHLHPLRVFVLVLAGGLFCCLVDALGALRDLRGPEKSAVAAAEAAVSAYVAARGGPVEEAARQRAAAALYETWAVLVTFQPARPKPDPEIRELRHRNLVLHLTFAGAPPDDSLLDQSLVLGRPTVLLQLTAAVRPGSRPIRLAVRSAVAALLAGGVASFLGVEHVYWAVAVAVLLLHQDLDWRRTVQKGIQRSAGATVGVFIAGAILAVHPQGLWLALVVGVLKVAIQLTLGRNYALAVVFVTPIAMTLAFAAVPDLDIPAVMLDRVCDTIIGALSALAVFAAMRRWLDTTRVVDEIDATLDAVADVLALDELSTPAARETRRNLHVRALALLPAFDAELGGTPAARRSVERLWPAVVVTQRLAFRVLDACWAAEHAGTPLPDFAAEDAAVRELAASAR